MNGYLTEIFGSFEGEGDRVGMPAVFVRLAGCNLSCSYCDTAGARERTESATLYLGKRESHIANPVSPRKLAGILGGSFPEYRDVRITGGEPLLQPEFLAESAPLLRAMGVGLHLETNGTLAAQMKGLKQHFDSVTMDMKLPSTQDGKDLAAEHATFLGTLAGGAAPTAVVVKIVVTPECGDDEVEAAFRLVAGVNRHVAVFLQPEFDDVRPVVGGGRLMRLMQTGLGLLDDVRLSLQMHKILRVR